MHNVKNCRDYINDIDPMTEEKNVQRNEAWREAMDRHRIRVLEMPECNIKAIPEDFAYRGHFLEVRLGERSAFCRFEGLGGAAWYGKERWITRFPDWEGYLLWALLNEIRETRAFSSMGEWLYAYGQFGGETENRREWDYAVRAVRDLEHLLGEPILEELRHIECDWDTNGL